MKKLKPTERTVLQGELTRHCRSEGYEDGMWVFLVAQRVNNLPAMQETQVRSLGWDDPLEEGMASHSIILACRISWTEESGQLQSLWLQRVRQD